MTRETSFIACDIFIHDSMRVIACLIVWAYIDISNGVSTKMDFGEDEPSYLVPDANNTEDEDVEVKHTIVVSTKLKNNNRRGIHANDGDKGTLTYRVGQPSPKKDDSGEVPVVGGYKAVETTRIKTPDSRHKAKIYPDAVFVSRNIRDDYDNVYPNVAANPMQWKPSNLYNNINWWSHDSGRETHTPRRPNNYNNAGKLHRKLSDDGAREFYCRKCTEYSNAQGIRGCSSTFVQQRSANPVHYETTTTKMKIDGKLAKLN